MSDSAERRSEKRGNKRSPSRDEVQLRVDAQKLTGTTRDTSGSGVFLISGDSLVVDVSTGEEGEEQTRRARVVRVETLPGECIGLALEFLP